MGRCSKPGPNRGGFGCLRRVLGEKLHQAWNAKRPAHRRPGRPRRLLCLGHTSPGKSMHSRAAPQHLVRLVTGSENPQPLQARVGGDSRALCPHRAEAAHVKAEDQGRGRVAEFPELWQQPHEGSIWILDQHLRNSCIAWLTQQAWLLPTDTFWKATSPRPSPFGWVRLRQGG